MPAIPTYTIQRDPPWIPARSAMRPSAVTMKNDPFRSVASEDVYHAHPAQQINDPGPQIRQSRLPIFKQVRSMLHRPPPITTPNNPKWDEYTGELSESGKPSKVKPSTFVSPFDGAFQAAQNQPVEKPKKNRKNQSPVSVLRDEEFTPVEQVNEDDRNFPRSPVSPVSVHSQTEDQFQEAIDPSLLPEPLSPNVRRLSQQTTPGSHAIKRKPVSRCTSAAENYPPISPQHSPSQSSDMAVQMDGEIDESTKEHPKSHFSWTTYAPTARHSIDTVATQETKGYAHEPQSRFSWSTVATQQARAESPPPPAPPIPTQYSSPPVQSILSRRRPVQRTEKAEWAPPPHARSRESTPFSTPMGGSTPTSASTARPLQVPKASTPTSASPSTDKALPLPPQLSSANNLTHLETLLAQERDIVLQRTNVERGIREMEKIVKASPLEVSFNRVRDAKKSLAEYRTRLDEVRLEERDIGVAITRARRREEKETGGDGETLWVRRVTS